MGTLPVPLVMAYEQHSRTEATDTSGRRIRGLLTESGHAVVEYQIIRDDAAELHQLLTDLLTRTDIDAVFTNGGTGISRRDTTVEVVERHLDQVLPGFGELFRQLSWEQIGSGAMMSRALGGVARGKLLFSMPGSTKAEAYAEGVEALMDRLTGS
jgi:molybdenum cofactor biosynthesis protein B